MTYGHSGSETPTAFEAIKQHFDEPNSDLPHNDWGKPEKLPKKSGSKS